MLGLLKECSRKHHFSSLAGWRSPSESVHLTFGRLFHAGMERYFHAIADGASHPDATLAMVRWALEATWDPDDGPWVPDPAFSASATKNRPSLIRSLIWCVEDDLTRPLSTVILANGKPAVELSFRFSAFSILLEGVETEILLCGHFDRLLSYDGRIWIGDHKTTGSALTANYWRQFTPHNQFSLYSIAGGVVLGEKCEGVLVSGVQIGTHYTRSAIHPVPRPKEVLSEWLREAQWWVQQAALQWEAQTWPGNDKSCHQYSGCEFQRVCAVSPTHRPAWLKADFAQNPWNPLETRGDI
jgi:hypothetical protein